MLSKIDSTLFPCSPVDLLIFHDFGPGKLFFLRWIFPAEWKFYSRQTTQRPSAGMEASARWSCLSLSCVICSEFRPWTNGVMECTCELPKQTTTAFYRIAFRRLWLLARNWKNINHDHEFLNCLFNRLFSQLVNRLKFFGGWNFVIWTNG